MSKFPDSHPIQFIRGTKRPGPQKILRTLTKRASYITVKLQEQAQVKGWDQVKGSGFMRELQAIGLIYEILEERQ